MTITKYREVYKPFTLPKAMEYYKTIELTYWRPEKASMSKDVVDFNLRITPRERKVTAGILKGFTIMECYVGDYWADVVSRIIPLHEVKAACYQNALIEANHSRSYAHLNDTLGLKDYEAFLTHPETKKKLDFFINHSKDRVSLAVFSGAGEGVSLFSSFAILLSMGKNGLFKGLSQIISWSARDEQAHSNFGIYLFKELVKETPLTKEEHNLIREGFWTVVQNELEFIEDIFQGEDLPTIRYSDLGDYIRYRANDRLKALGLDPMFILDGSYQNIAEWFEAETKGQVSNDFFDQPIEGGNYSSTLPQDFDGFDYSIFKEYSKCH